jgi:hypothetical protein
MPFLYNDPRNSKAKDPKQQAKQPVQQVRRAAAAHQGSATSSFLHVVGFLLWRTEPGDLAPDDPGYCGRLGGITRPVWRVGSYVSV